MKITEIFKRFRQAILRENISFSSPTKFWISPSGKLYDFGDFIDHGEFIENSKDQEVVQRRVKIEDFNAAKATVHFIKSGWIRGQISGQRSFQLNFSQPGQSAISAAIKQINKNLCQFYFIDNFQDADGSKRFTDKKEAIQYLLGL